jgi:hypothetical protein
MFEAYSNPELAVRIDLYVLRNNVTDQSNTQNPWFEFDNSNDYFRMWHLS